MFWVAVGLFTITVGLFFGTIFTSSMPTGWKCNACALLIAIVIGFVIAGLLSIQEQGNAERWNNGFCPTCNIHWTPSGATRSQYGSVTKYYYCSDCFKEISIID